MLCAGKFSSYEVHWWKVACIPVRYFLIKELVCLVDGKEPILFQLSLQVLPD